MTRGYLRWQLLYDWTTLCSYSTQHNGVWCLEWLFLPILSPLWEQSNYIEYAAPTAVDTEKDKATAL